VSRLIEHETEISHRSAKTPRTAINHAPALATYPICAAFFFVGDGDDDAVGVEVAVGVVVFTRTYNSPVVSELMNSRSFESNARPTGLKHLSGHFELSTLASMSVVEFKLSDFATGDPFSKAMEETL